MNKIICIVAIALHLTACGSARTGDAEMSTAALETTTTTTITTTITKETTTTTTVITTVTPETTTENTEWTRREWVFTPICHLDTIVYASPSTDSEQLGVIPAGGRVNDISRVNDTSNWIVIEWNGDVAFIEGTEVYEETPTTGTDPQELITIDEPITGTTH